jgi:hypothetical protein
MIFLNRSRRDLMRAVDAGRVGRTVEGKIMRRGASTGRCDGAVRELEDAGWVRLGPDRGTYELTGEGITVLGDAR